MTDTTTGMRYWWFTKPPSYLPPPTNYSLQGCKAMQSPGPLTHIRHMHDNGSLWRRKDVHLRHRVLIRPQECRNPHIPYTWRIWQHFWTPLDRAFATAVLQSWKAPSPHTSWVPPQHTPSVLPEKLSVITPNAHKPTHSPWLHDSMVCISHPM